MLLPFSVIKETFSVGKKKAWQEKRQKPPTDADVTLLYDTVATLLRESGPPVQHNALLPSRAAKLNWQAWDCTHANLKL